MRGKASLIENVRRSGLTDIKNQFNVPVKLMSSANLLIEPAAIEQALQFLAIKDIAAKEMLLTPDLHKGSLVPVGLVADLNQQVVPAMIGRDIGCGMRLLVLEGLDPAQIKAKLPDLKKRLRQIFFEGGRDLQTTSRQREMIFRYGLYGLDEELKDQQGLWSYYDRDRAQEELLNVHNQGAFSSANRFAGFDRYAGQTGPDPQLGSLGGGNHFCELTVVDRQAEGQTAHQWGLKDGAVCLFIHSGSLAIGGAVGNAYHYKPGQKKDEIRVLNSDDKDFEAFIGAMNNAANFAFANRLALGLMAEKAIAETLQIETKPRLVYDAPHNFIEAKGDLWRHRKGATPAQGSDHNITRFSAGHPALVPGSMGAASWVLAGSGSEEALQSVAHGAGRALSRSAAAQREDAGLEDLEVVTPIDPRHARSDILAEHQRRLREEAPSAYKSLEPVIDAIAEAQAARRVAKLKPIMTVKG
jgi:tRNA-splicing ligase RtcB (3'-phosphate/5'-hydroxy nucleic acid ligase)